MELVTKLKLIPNLPPKSVFVTNNVSCHNMEGTKSYRKKLHNEPVPVCQ